MIQPGGKVCAKAQVFKEPILKNMKEADGAGLWSRGTYTGIKRQVSFVGHDNILGVVSNNLISTFKKCGTMKNKWVGQSSQGIIVLSH